MDIQSGIHQTRPSQVLRGLDIHFETHGSGEPLVLLHGGVGASEMFAPLIPALAAHRQVITVDLRGHGRTPDVGGSLTYEAMADDVAAVLEHLKLDWADLAGYSLGGGVALHVASRHSQRVRNLVLMSIAFRRSGWYPEVRATFDVMGPEFGEGMRHSPLSKLYPYVDWRRLFGKLGEMQRKDHDWSSQVKALKARTLLVFADGDAVPPSHIAELYGMLGGGQRDAGLDGAGHSPAQLAVLPGRTHYNLLGSPILGPVLSSFLAEQPQRRTTP
jgi:pimeloyl-ACP methyl ester carboxylesterase